MKTQQTTEIMSNVSKHIIVLLCALLSTGCMDEDFFTSGKDRPTDYREGPIPRPRHDGDLYRYGKHETFPGQFSDYSVRNNTDDRKNINHNWSGVDAKPPTQATSKKPDKKFSKVFEKGCTICCDENAYKTHPAVQCERCEEFVCQPCYENINEASETLTTFDYGDFMTTGTYWLKKKCPFCRKNF